MSKRLPGPKHKRPTVTEAWIDTTAFVDDSHTVKGFVPHAVFVVNGTSSKLRRLWKDALYRTKCEVVESWDSHSAHRVIGSAQGLSDLRQCLAVVSWGLCLDVRIPVVGQGAGEEKARPAPRREMTVAHQEHNAVKTFGVSARVGSEARYDDAKLRKPSEVSVGQQMQEAAAHQEAVKASNHTHTGVPEHTDLWMCEVVEMPKTTSTMQGMTDTVDHCEAELAWWAFVAATPESDYSI